MFISGPKYGRPAILLEIQFVVRRELKLGFIRGLRGRPWQMAKRETVSHQGDNSKSNIRKLHHFKRLSRGLLVGELPVTSYNLGGDDFGHWKSDINMQPEDAETKVAERNGCKIITRTNDPGAPHPTFLSTLFAERHGKY